MEGAGLAQGLARGIEGIGHVAQVFNGTAELFQQRAQHGAVGVVDSAGRQRLAGLDQFVAGGQQAYRQPPEHRQHGRADGRRHADRLGRKLRADRQHLGALAHVLAGAADVLAGPGHMVDHDRIAGLLAPLLHYHGIGAGGHRRTGENARRGTRRQGVADAAGRNALGHRQPGAGGNDVGQAHRIAVHGAVVQRRYVDGRHHGLGEDAPGGLGQRQTIHALDAARRGEQLVQRLVEGKHGIVHSPTCSRMNAAMASRSLMSSCFRCCGRSRATSEATAITSGFSVQM